MAQKILIVTNDAAARAVIASFLKTEKYEAEFVTRVENAVGEARGFCPDLLACDVDLADGNGFQLALELRRHCSELQVLLLADTESLDHLVTQTMARGHDFSVLIKPLAASRLRQWIKLFLPTDFKAKWAA